MTPLRVALPLGVGDSWWTAQKLGALSRAHEGRPIHAFINRSPNHRTVDFLRLVAAIDHAEESGAAPFDVHGEMPPTCRHPRWWTLDGARGWRGFDYVLVANGALEVGKRIEDWMPELAADYSPALRIPAEAEARATELFGEAAPFLIYMSGIGPNRGFHNGWWHVNAWVDVVRRLNDADVIPHLIGADTADDRGYRDLFLKVGGTGLRFEDRVGQTPIAVAMAAIRRARCLIGLSSGLGIVGASLGTPTVMLWADQRFAVTGAGSLLHPHMQTAWLSPDQQKRYRSFSYGSPATTPEAVATAALEVAS